MQPSILICTVTTDLEGHVMSCPAVNNTDAHIKINNITRYDIVRFSDLSGFTLCVCPLKVMITTTLTSDLERQGMAIFCGCTYENQLFVSNSLRYCLSAFCTIILLSDLRFLVLKFRNRTISSKNEKIKNLRITQT